MRTKLSLAIAAITAIGLSACSSSGGNGSGSGNKDSASPVSTPSSPGNDFEKLGGLLLASGEEPGYQPVGPVTTDTDYAGIAAEDNLAADVLHDAGFVGLVSRQLNGRAGVGVSSLVLFHSAKGAATYAGALNTGLETNLATAKPKRFAVPYVPGAFGYTATFDGRHVANIVWVEGSCVLTVGNESDSALAPALNTGAQRWHDRMNGMCPVPGITGSPAADETP